MVFFASCRSASFFESPNSLRNIHGTLHLNNGNKVEGKLVIATANALGSEVKIFLDGEKKPQKFNLHDVQGYQIRNEYYELKEIKSAISLGRNLSFMKRLTPDNSRIHLYENMEENTNTRTDRNGNTSTRRTWDLQYYMQLPSEAGDAVWAVNSSRFVPNFDEKMSRLVSDCPALAQKITNKEPGYFYAQVSVFREKRADVLLTIINEYNRCR